MSNLLVSNTGSPQGYVLSPLLFILYRDSCRSSKEGRYPVKFSDDTALLSPLQAPESDHGSALLAFVDWCDHNLLDLDVSKTKKLIINFKKNNDKPKPSIKQRKNVEIVDT